MNENLSICIRQRHGGVPAGGEEHHRRAARQCGGADFRHTQGAVGLAGCPHRQRASVPAGHPGQHRCAGGQRYVALLDAAGSGGAASGGLSHPALRRAGEGHHHRDRQRHAYRRRRGGAAHPGDGCRLRPDHRGKPQLRIRGSCLPRHNAPRHAGLHQPHCGPGGYGHLPRRGNPSCDGWLRRRTQEHPARYQRPGDHLPQPCLFPGCYIPAV